MPNEGPIFSSPLLGVTVTLGNLAIWLGLASAVTCVVLYWMTMLRTLRQQPQAATETSEGNGKKNGGKAAPAVDPKTERLAQLARRFFFITSGFVVLGSLALWTLIFSQQYSVHYVWKNSNSNLPFFFRLASFWSDQEGTFFLWAIYNTILGTVLLRKAQQDERWVMPFFALINVSLFTLLCFMNPFWMHDTKMVRTDLVSSLEREGLTPDVISRVLSFLPVTTGQRLAYYFGWGKYWIMRDGKGLNEQLQNFWMVIHPPTLFVGYASMIIPSCFALGALMRRDYDSWVPRAAPWLAFSWAVLGTGIFLGAYWAYETLGWGGYWSWDPVENSSLIPWLVGTTLIHGLLAQRSRGNFKQANLFLGLMAGFAVLLGSFLVRSGVLSETSVHSFASPQQNVFNTLLAIMGIWFVMSMAIWLWRFKDIQSEIAYETVWERHFGFFLGLIVLSAISVVVIFGVTLPIWKPWLPGLGGKVSVDYTFYNKALLPVCFVLVLLMGLTPLLPWRRVREDRETPLFNKVALGLAAVFTLFFMFAAFWAWQGGFKTQNDPAYLGFGLILALSLVTNLVCMKRAARGGLLAASPWVTHVGFIVTLGGIIITSRFNTTHSFMKVDEGASVTALGRQFTYKGLREAKGKGDKNRFLVEMTKDGKTTLLEPKFFISQQSGQPQLMAWPTIINEWIGGAWGDVYVTPAQVGNGAVMLNDVKKDSPDPTRAIVQHRRSDPEDEITLQLTGLDLSEMQRAMKTRSREPFTVYAEVTLNVNGVEQQVKPGLRLIQSEGQPRTEPTPLRLAGLNQGTGYSLLFKDTNMEPGNVTANFELQPDEPVSQGYFQVMHVPGIQILWFGCYTMFAGAFLCWRRRVQLARRTSPATAPGVVRTPRPGRAPQVEPVGAE